MVKDDCIFCKIARGDIPSATICEDENFRVILDLSPANKGHALIIPKEHFDNIYSMNEETAAKVFPMAVKIANAMKDELNCDGLNIVQNNNEVAGQTVFHFHMHVIPRFVNDGVKLTWTQKETIPEEQEKLAKAIASHLH